MAPWSVTFFISYFTLLSFASAQDDFLAKRYFEDGAFDKAVVFYEKLVEKDPRRTDYTEGLVACYQQLERYTDAEKLLLEEIELVRPNPSFYIELGYNYTLQNSPEKANEYTKRFNQEIGAQ